MKRIKNILVLLLVVVLIGGCTIKSEYNINIKSDKSMTFFLIMALDDEAIESMDENLERSSTAATLSNAEDQTWSYVDAVEIAFVNNQTSSNPVQLPVSGDITADSVIGEIKVSGSPASSGTFYISSEGVVTISDLVFDGYTCETNEDATDVTCVQNEENITMGEETAEDTRLTDEEKWNILENAFDTEYFEGLGYVVERYEEDNLMGYKISKEFEDIEQVTYSDLLLGFSASITMDNGELVGENTIPNLVTKQDNIYKISYISEVNENSANSDNSIMSGVGEHNTSIILTLPNKPISHNATSVSEDGKTLTWNVSDDNFEGIEVEFSLTDNLIIYIIAGVITLLVLIIIILVVRKMMNKKKKDNSNKTDDSIVIPNQPKGLDSVSSVSNSTIVQEKPVIAPSPEISSVTPMPEAISVQEVTPNNSTNENFQSIKPEKITTVPNIFGTNNVVQNSNQTSNNVFNSSPVNQNSDDIEKL